MSLYSVKQGLRVIATGFCFIVFGVGATLISVYFLLVAMLPLKKLRKQSIVRRTISKASLFYLWVMASLGLLTIHFDVELAQKSSGKLIVANHPTLLDAIFFLSHMDDLCCIVKDSLWQNPFTLIMVTMAGYIPNDSETLIDEVSAKLRSGENILIFPEGTRNTYDDQLDFKRGAANIAIAANCQLLPLLIKCTPRTLQKHAKLHDVPASSPHFSFQVFPAITIADCIDTSRPRTVQYRHLTEYLREYYRPHLSSKSEAGEIK